MGGIKIGSFLIGVNILVEANGVHAIEFILIHYQAIQVTVFIHIKKDRLGTDAHVGKSVLLGFFLKGSILIVNKQQIFSLVPCVGSSL